MLPVRQETIIRQLDKLVNESITDFETGLNPAEKEVAELVSDFAGRLKRYPNGTIKPLMENFKLIDKFRLEFDKLLSTGKYSIKVNSFLKSFSSASSIINDYFAVSIEGYVRNENLLKAILEANISTTVEALMQTGMHDKFREPVINLLKSNVSGNSSIVSLRQQLSRQILSTSESSGLLTRHVKRVASDSLETFTRSYMQAVSNDLSLEHYFYAGTEIGSTRPFCKARVGKYFTKQEVEKWPELEWSGKIAGTNKTTIYIWLAGHGCRHRLLPVSAELYNKRVKQ